MSTIVLSVLTAICTGLIAWFGGLQPFLVESKEVVAIAGTMASVASTMLGFMLAALAVLASINNTHLVRMMHLTGHYRDLLVSLFVGSLIFLLCCVGSYLLLLGVQPREWFVWALLGGHCAAVLGLIDIGRKFWMVLKNLRP